ncbi:MAG: hypothetical protein A3K10_08680 [Bacteroidetes bacterium RIFCSPLOWO2_12_FULL_31_6]|nr:MAG: hypothetical protein A3K10_08680 [Bacteroidetes bacterium RIFCSPLOWO2_12_FULL_31_6]
MNRYSYISIVLLVISLLFSIYNIQAQTYFDKEFKNNLTYQTLGSSIYSLTDTNGYMVVGNIPTSSNTSLYLIRLNMYGDTVWSKIFGNNLLLEYSGLGKMISIGDTNFIFTGTTFTDSLTQTADSSMISLCKVDLNGTVLWQKYYGDSNKLSYGNDIQQTSDGGFIVTGWTTGWGNTIYNSSFLLKVDALGNDEWHKIYGGGSSTNQRDALSVDLTDNNGYMLSGRFYQGLATRYDINVIKTDSLGNIIWNKTYGTVEDDNAGYISKYGDTGDYILTAAIDIAPGNILDDFQAYIARIKGTDGSIIWADTFGIVNNGTNDVFSSNPIILDNGDIVGIGGTHFSSSGGGVDAWLVKYDGNGNRLWQRTFNKYGSNNQHYFWDIQSTFDKGFVICGDLTNISIPEKNLWVLKLDSMGCEIANCSVGVEKEEIVLNSTVRVYPNPTIGIVTIQYDATIFTYSTFKLFDVMGKEMLNKKIKSNTTSIDVSSYPKGVYFYFIRTETGGQIIHQKQQISGKLIIQ